MDTADSSVQLHLNKWNKQSELAHYLDFTDSCNSFDYNKFDT